jgi:hypothetical protein
MARCDVCRAPGLVRRGGATWSSCRLAGKSDYIMCEIISDPRKRRKAAVRVADWRWGETGG